MKKIKYSKLSIQNFMAIGNDAVVVDFERGLNLIRGDNKDNPDRKNAVGKTTIPNAFCYSLFGETLEKIKNEFIVNFTTKGKGKVELDFSVQDSKGTQTYKIIRQVKPSKVFLFKGDEDITRDSISNTNKYICNLISTNSAIHKSCEVMTMSNTTPFMSKTAADKRKFVEDIFDIEVFGLMLKDLKKLITENKKNVSVNSALVEESNTAIATAKSQITDLENEIKNRDKEIAIKVEEIERQKLVISGDIDVIVADISKIDIPDLMSKEEKVEGHIVTYNENKKEQEAAASAYQVKLVDIRAEKKPLIKAVSGSGTCSECLQGICVEHVVKIQDDIDKLTQQENVILGQLDYANEQITKTCKTVSDLEGILSTIADKKARYNALTDNVNNLRDRITQLDRDIELIKGHDKGKTSIEKFQANLDKLTATCADRVEEGAKLNRTTEDYNVCKFILGEEGVKSFAIKRLVGLLNGTISEYLTGMGLSIKCVFDEYFDAEITTTKGKKLSYTNLSGAERRSVDIACSLSFSDMRRRISGVSTNVEFYDEIFDSAFDELGLDMFISILKKRIVKNKMCVYAISHRKETAKHVDGETIMLEKERDVTRRVDK